jgi:hypothetical protein
VSVKNILAEVQEKQEEPDVIDHEQEVKNKLKEEKDKIKKTYEGKLKKLNCCQHIYLWIRRNYV